MSLIWLLDTSRNCRRSRPLTGARLVIWFSGSVSEASAVHFSRPVRSLMPALGASIIETVATSSAVMTSWVSRLAKTCLRTAASSALSMKMATGLGGGGLAAAAGAGTGGAGLAGAGAGFSGGGAGLAGAGGVGFTGAESGFASALAGVGVAGAGLVSALGGVAVAAGAGAAAGLASCA